MIHHRFDAPAEDSAGYRSDDIRLIACTLLLSAAYATLRYNLFKGVPWSDWPDYIGNKAAALSSLVLITVAVFRLASRKPRPIARLMAAGSALALAHTLVSLALWQPAYFDKFFAGQKVSPAGGASLMFAALAMALLHWGKGRPGSSVPSRSARWLVAIALLSGLHAGIPSLATWFRPVAWPGGMPPITLLSFLIALAAAGSLARIGKA